MDVTSPTELTPVEERNGRLYKREDLHRDPVSGVNGSKFRVCRHLIERAFDNGANHIVSASSVLSPQAAMAGVLADQYSMECTLVFGATTPESAVKHVSPRIAVDHGAVIDAVKARPAYNNSIQKRARELAEGPGAWQLPYGISVPDDAPREDLEAFLAVNGKQVLNLPLETKTLVMTLGSGNTAAGVLYGLDQYGYHLLSLERLVLVGVGPHRLQWMWDRLERVGIHEDFLSFDVQHEPIHGWFAEYADKMPETVDGIVLHPTYEGKLARYLNATQPDWWTRRDGTTCLWIVGGPIG